jgi:putative colanic acid biosynthesis acetyltransferase WcaF
MANPRLITMQQASAYESPWSLGKRIKTLLWNITWMILFRPTPKKLSPWRVLLLRAFGAHVDGVPFVAASVRVTMPWNLQLADRACLGPDVRVYNLAMITLRPRCTVAQEVYLCAGTHDLSRQNLPLVVGEITIGDDAFLGVRALVLPGIDIGPGAVVGAGAVVTRDLPPWMICAGNPCRPIKPRLFDANPTHEVANIHQRADDE